MPKSTRLTKPRHFIIQTTYLDGTTKNLRLNVTPAHIQQRAECMAKEPGVDVVLILNGQADPDNPHPDHIINRVEPQPFTEYGVQATKLKDPKRLMRTRDVGTADVNSVVIERRTVYTGLGRW